ncbi:hypothetical protein AAG906_040360 [Vitis piasezkii]
MGTSIRLIFWENSETTLVGSAFPTYLKAVCPTTDLYSPNSTYQGNLQHLLSSLYSKAKYGTGFFNTSCGSFPDTVYGSFLCRGDVSADVCLDCVETASREIIIRCPNQKGAITWYDECQLHYSSQSFFSVDADHPVFSLHNENNISNPDQFSRVLNEAMTSLVSQVAFDPSRHMFATKEVNITAYQTLYVLGQCTLDLSGSICYSCLLNSVAYLPTCCDGKIGGRVLRASCNVRYELYLFYTRSAIAPTPSAIPHPTVRTTDEGKDGLSFSTTLAIVVPTALAVVVILSLCYILLTRKAIKKENHVGNESQPVGSLQFDLDTIRAATDNFADANKIDEGGYGTVYKGILSNGEEISVKRLLGDSGEIAEAFKKEVFLMAKLQHRNLQRLLGFCSGGGERMLIYEFVSNDCLDSLLFDPENRAQLDWPMRLKIIEGIARGLLYLHDDAPLRIIHCDLKVSNILLDGKMNAKISNFGMAIGWVDDQTLVNPHRIAGTYGHFAPECVMHGQFSSQSDVYSFGVLLLEIEDAADRPSMASVVLMLSSDPSTLPMPRSLPPSVPHRAEPQRTAGELEPSARELGECNAEIISIDEVTFSELSPR